MKLLVVSHKECWPSPGGEGYVTVGGFPDQMAALSSLFTETRLRIFERRPPPPPGARALHGHRLTVDPLREPAGTLRSRRLALLLRSPLYLARLWRSMAWADAVHALVPGDLGTIGLFLALLRRERLLVRHCGTWGHRATAADRVLARLLPRIAGGRNVVLATGGGDSPPCPGNPAVSWIFSTTLGSDDLARLPVARPWQAGEPLRLIQVGRLTAGKNAAASLRALPLIRRRHDARLDVVGDGPDRERLEALADEQGVRTFVEFHGNVPRRRVLELLGRSHLFLFPTRVAEGFPKAVHEAMACGVPILVPRVSVLPVLAEAGAGVVLEEPVADRLAAAVERLAADPQRLASLSAGARAAAQRYTLEHWRDTIRSRIEEAWGPSATLRPS